MKQRFALHALTSAAAIAAAISLGGLTGCSLTGADEASQALGDSDSPKGVHHAAAGLASVANPTLAKRCGLDVVLVLDASSSVRNYDGGAADDDNGAVDLVAGAAQAFLQALSGTNTRVGVVSYNAETVIQLGLEDVNAVSLAPGGAHAVAIGDPGGPLGPIPVTTGYSEHARRGSGTNWEGGLLAAQQVLLDADRDAPLLVVHVTDGIPTRHIDVDGNVTDEGSKAVHVAEAATAADVLKAAGVHVYSVGIGRAGSDDDYVDELEAVSGPDVYDQGDDSDVFDAADDDVILAIDFAALEAVLDQLAGELCGASLTITKLASTAEAPDVFAPAQGVEFTARPDATSGYNWLLPEDGAATQRAVVTDDLGRAQFQWNVVSDTAWGEGTIHIIETPMDGFEMQPEVHCVSGDQSFVVMADVATGTFQVDLGLGDTVSCEVRNIPTAAAEPPDFEVCVDVDICAIPRDGGVVDFTVFLFNHDDEVLHLESIHDSILGDLLDPDNPRVVDGYCTSSLDVGGSYGCSWEVWMDGGQPGTSRTHTTEVVFVNGAGVSASATYETTLDIGYW